MKMKNSLQETRALLVKRLSDRESLQSYFCYEQQYNEDDTVGNERIILIYFQDKRMSLSFAMKENK